MVQKIRHINVIWDECEHLSKRKVAQASEAFYKYYVHAFPEGKKTPESPMIVPTSSPIISEHNVQSFYHDGGFVPFEGKYKDIALVKYCSTGFFDSNEKFHFLVDELRNMRHNRGDPPMLANDSVLNIFITSDWASGMNEALDYIQKNRKTAIKCNFISLRIPKNIQGDRMARISYAANAIGIELQKRFIKLENDLLHIDLELN